jgi:hypothetical protein
MTRKRTSGTGVARGALVCLLAALLGTGCTTVTMSTGPLAAFDSPAAALTVRTYDRPKDAEAGHLSSSRVVSTLTGNDGSTLSVEGGEAVFDGIAPGDYRLTVRQWKKGLSGEDAPSAEKSARVRLRAGERAGTSVVVQHTSTGTIVAITAGILAGLAIIGAIAIQNTRLWEDDRLAPAGTEGHAFSPVPGQRPSTPSQPRVP